MAVGRLTIDEKTKTLILIQKGGTEKRLPISDVVMGLLEEFREASQGELNFVFHDLRSKRDQPITGTAVYLIVKNLIRGIFPDSKLTPHSFRKGFIEQALNRKNDLVSIVNATGHASIEMVKYYDTRDARENNAIHDVGEMVNW